LWYSLGILSIATSKILLSGGIVMRVSPLTLTLQQLLIGSTLLRFLLRMGFLGSSLSPPAAVHLESSSKGHHPPTADPQTRELQWASICFALGFLATNFGFAGSAASFVETVKAAEPLTSATVAAVYGIETITLAQKASLGTIVAGVLLSTLGSGGGRYQAQPLAAAILSSCIVMTSNLCFSFRGLYQKLFRKEVPAEVLDDLNLQFRMQWTGVVMLALPVVVFDLFPLLVWGRDQWSTTLLPGDLTHYFLLALLNGCAFTSYNLASTYILSRISVVHHAALNCVRRVFAIVVTSLLFGIPITTLGAVGIGLAVTGFMLYTHYKIQQQNTNKLMRLSGHQPHPTAGFVMPFIDEGKHHV